MITQELKPVFENINSYHNKATVLRGDDYIQLISYGDIVARTDKEFKNFEILIDLEKCTRTTGRHIKEFYNQFFAKEINYIHSKNKKINASKANLFNHYGNKKQ